MSVDGGGQGVGVEEAADSKVRVIRLGVSHAEESTTRFQNQNELQPSLTFRRITALFRVLALLVCFLAFCLFIIKWFVSQFLSSGGCTARHSLKSVN